ncbi:MAG: 50S ribosomal protein L21 [Candidatus Nomurabacteria bacterium]|jgi:large subunit ribosomal protein L21|nr:50S ribosomal protein L21 [Candidatus Nomurabacteria bacterium]
MKKAVIEVSGKQYLVTEGETLAVDLQSEGTKSIGVAPMLVIDGDKTTVGMPTVAKSLVKADVVEELVKGEKLRVIRYKSKKHVHKEIGHRQKYTTIKIASIA